MLFRKIFFLYWHIHTKIPVTWFLGKRVNVSLDLESKYRHRFFLWLEKFSLTESLKSNSEFSVPVICSCLVLTPVSMSALFPKKYKLSFCRCHGPLFGNYAYFLTWGCQSSIHRVRSSPTQRPWVRFWGAKIAAGSCTHLGPAQVMEVIIIDI